MKSLLLYLDGDFIKSTILLKQTDALCIGSTTFYKESLYFGDWMALRDVGNKIVGFKLLPFVEDEYLERLILPARFIKHSKNASVEKRKSCTYLNILLQPCKFYTEHDMNKIDAVIFHNRKDDFIVRLDSLSDQECNDFAFSPEDLPN